MEATQLAKLQTSGASAVLHLDTSTLLIRQAQELIKFDVKDKTVKQSIEMGRYFEFQPCAVIGNTYLEFDTQYTLIYDLTDDVVTEQEGLHFVSGLKNASFFQYGSNLMVLSNSHLYSIDLEHYERARPIVQLPQCDGAVLVPLSAT